MKRIIKNSNEILLFTKILSFIQNLKSILKGNPTLELNSTMDLNSTLTINSIMDLNPPTNLKGKKILKLSTTLPLNSILKLCVTIFIFNATINLTTAANNVPAKIYYYIALTDRSLNIPLIGWIADHTIVEYWESTRNLNVAEEYSFFRTNPRTIKRETVELLGETYIETLFCSHHNNCKIESKVTISVITYNNTENLADDDYVVMEKFEEKSTTESSWGKNYINNAKKYGFAEQQGFNGNFKKWTASNRNSEYQILGNNCHTFTRYLCGDSWVDMWGFHPGNKFPQPIAGKDNFITWNSYDEIGNIIDTHYYTRLMPTKK